MNRLHPRRAACLGLILTLASAQLACHRDSGHRRDRRDFDLGRADGGWVAGQFQTLEDYLEHPTVQLVLDNMPSFLGNTPPDLSGTYDAFGGLTETTIPGSDTGDAVTAAFCFGPPAGDRLEARILDSTVEDGGANSFIEGSGDQFTVYTAFRSVQDFTDGTRCEIHEVNVFSGRRLANGNLDDLHIGVAIVGLIGACDPFIVGDVQISRLAGERVGEACSPDPGAPGNLDKVQVAVENLLLNDLLIFDDPSDQALSLAEIAPLSTETVELDPGFELDFESVRPLAGQDADGNDLFMGEVIAGFFPADTTPAGGTVTFVIENLVGEDEYFAPRPINSTAEDIFSVVNIGVDVPELEESPGGGLDCLCVLPPTPAGEGPYDIGYYSYSSPGIVTPEEVNVHFFSVADETEITAPFLGPELPLPDTGTGSILIEVIDDSGVPQA